VIGRINGEDVAATRARGLQTYDQLANAGEFLAGLSSQVGDEFQQCCVNLGGLLLLGPVAGTLNQNDLLQIRNKCLHPVTQCWPQHGIVFSGDHKRRLFHQVFQSGAFFPASVEAAVPVEAAAKTSPLEGAGENLEIVVG
jgi:hypothetical protein